MSRPLTADERSACMRAVRSKDTGPEMRVRKLIHSLGYRYALHINKLPGKPDIVFVSRKKIIFVHGCFWHKHNCRRGSICPVTNADYWNSKRQRNNERDKQHMLALRKDGWKVLVIWECQIKNVEGLRKKIDLFLSTRTSSDSSARSSPSRSKPKQPSPACPL